MRLAIGWVVLLCRGRRLVPPGRKDTPATPASPGGAADARLERHALGRSGAIDLNAAIIANIGSIVGALAAGFVLLLALALLLWRRTRHLDRRLFGITRGSDERSLEAILEAHLTRVHQVVRELGEVEARTAILESDLQRTFARVGLVRYNPFEDTGGNQSFALALLDAHGDGFVMSSLHARNQTRVYVKGVKAGRSDSGVSNEEAEALRIAMAAPVVAGPAS